MKKILPVGYEDIREIADRNLYYVDKSLMIRELLERGGKVNLFTRPRRFGKTLNLSMIRRFFELERNEEGIKIDNSYIFQDLRIARCREICRKHQQEYPVITLTMKSARQPDFQMARDSLIDEIAKEVGGFDFILADLGVSSMQIDNPKRGFSFKVDGPLDLRLNQEKGISAAERLDTISREELAGMLYENSDEPYCEELAKAITEEIRKGHRIDTTTKLRQVIEQTLSFLPENKEKKDIIRKTCQRTFQALRIDVNHEFEVLYEFMEKLPGTLKPGGRVAILTFHSGEDKLVKKALKAGYREGVYSEYAKDVVRPSAEECAQNGRARSTKMRWAVKAE